MIRNIVTIDYYRFEVNGYKCAVGVEVNDEHQGYLVMIKSKFQVDETEILGVDDHEYVLKWFDVDFKLTNGIYPNERACIQAFLDEANPLLASQTGGHIPPFPDHVTDRLIWLVKLIFLG